MAAETALIIGLSTVVYLTIKLAKELEEADTQLNQGLFVGSMLFLIGMLYTGYGIAIDASIQEAERAYLASLILVSIAFIGLVIRLVQKYKAAKEESELTGFQD